MNEETVKELIKALVKTALNDAATCSHSPYSVSNETIPVELSARHAHLSEADAIALFGEPLTPVKELSQPGQFAAKQRVRLIGPKGVMDNVAVLGPSRGASQVEISKTDARILGIDAPVRQSGDVQGTPGIILASQTGIVGMENGVIVASRHIHISVEEASRFGVNDGDMVSVQLDTDRPIILKDVLIRVNPNFRLSMHIDADEGNSANWKPGTLGRIISKC